MLNTFSHLLKITTNLNKFIFFILVVLVLFLSSCSDKNNDFKNFKGTISNKYQITGSLNVENEIISGYYYYDKYKIPLDISGFCKGDSLFFSGLDKGGNVIDKFEGVLDKNKINGIWIKGRGSKNSTFEINQNKSPYKNYSIVFIIFFLVLIPICFLFKSNKKESNEEDSNKTNENLSSTINYYKPKNQEVIDSNKTTVLSNNKNSNEEKGNDFENFIVELFGNKFFTLIDWRPDKISNKNNIYAKSNFYPDLHYEIKNNNTTYQFAVECKYRSKTDSIIKIALNRQLENYRKFSIDKRCPVFIVLGLGGSSQNPNELFIIPLNRVKEEMPYDQLKKEFIKRNRNLFYDFKNEKLN